MMNTTYEQHQLPANFTFRIVEMVKRVKIHTMPRSTGLPWGLSLAAGIAVVVMTFGSQMAVYKQPTPLAFPSETETLKVREMSVDILSGPQTSVMAGKQGNADGVGMDQRSPESKSLLAPAKGGGTWTQKADMPTARSTTGSAVVDGKIYVIGGYTAAASFIEVAEEYNPATDTWRELADMPSARQCVPAAAVDGIIYAIGGWNNSNDNSNPKRPFMSVVEAYDPATGKWTRKADMPTPRDGMTASVVDGEIYVIGGLGWGAVGLSAVEAYDPATDRWTKKVSMPTARCLHAACVVDGRIYVFGGTPGWDWALSAYSTTLATVEVYDPSTDTWTQASDMPVVRYMHSASAVAGKIYIIGGQDEETIKLWEEGKIDGDELEEVFSIVYVYDPATDTWTTAADPLPTPRAGLTAAVVDGKIYAIGGQQGSERLSTVEEYDPGLPHAVSTVKPERKALTTWGAVK